MIHRRELVELTRIPLEADFCAGEIYKKLLELERLLVGMDYGLEETFRVGNLYLTVRRGKP